MLGGGGSIHHLLAGAELCPGAVDHCHEVSGAYQHYVLPGAVVHNVLHRLPGDDGDDDRPGVGQSESLHDLDQVVHTFTLGMVGITFQV